MLRVGSPVLGLLLGRGRRRMENGRFWMVWGKSTRQLRNTSELFLKTVGRRFRWLVLKKLSNNRGTSLLLGLGGNSSNLTELAIVVLDSMLIRFSNPYEEILRTCPKITSLDLSRNLVSELATVAEICRPLKELKTLRLTGNRFSRLSLTGDLTDAFERVEWLALNMCALRWDEVLYSRQLIWFRWNKYFVHLWE